jgi:hypothetical protein
MMSGALVGGEATLGLGFAARRMLSAFGKIGYRYLRGVSTWVFDVERGGQQVRLDSTGLPFSGTDFSARGLFFRAGLSF